MAGLVLLCLQFAPIVVLFIICITASNLYYREAKHESRGGFFILQNTCNHDFTNNVKNILPRYQNVLSTQNDSYNSLYEKLLGMVRQLTTVF